jgi:4-alpha-glucanotransferase
MVSQRLPVLDRRRAGVLLPLSALDAALGSGGRGFIDWLAAAGFSVWQILPMGPVGRDGSPYWVRSDCAGNRALLDPTELPDEHAPIAPQFLAAAAGWLPDYALFEALTAAYRGMPFWGWPAPLRDRDPDALKEARSRLVAEVSRIERDQYAFDLQWQGLREHARARGVRLFGDLPYYVAPSSVETWAHRELFQLTPTGAPAMVGGVPPDYFSALGQLWGNPVYDWQALERTGFAWWVARVRAQLARLDLLRVDHFRALSAYWAVPAAAADARGGAWCPAPGRELLERLRQELGELPLAAEDLGVITADVLALRDAFALPGMRVLQFGFDGTADNIHVPYRHERNSIVYTGTHDNDTTLGWYAGLDGDIRARVDFYLGTTPAPMPAALIRAALGSVAQVAVLPAQDILGLGSQARLNTPGTTAGNWQWRLPAGALTAQLARSYAQLNGSFGRA